MSIGAGCGINNEIVLEEGKMQPVLELTGNELGWSGSIIRRGPNEKNYYGNSLVIYGPAKDDVGNFTNSNLEIIEFGDLNFVKYAYSQEKCFKGSGKPIKILGMEACCLNDETSSTSEAVMMKGKYLFRSYDALHSDCKAGEHLKKFWENYKQ
ncbi:hypothetical protein KJ885_01425 [Patescibacteria group bacterium]|nr:hypothetical protein [Patescibacteria group bacterium]